MVNIKILKRLNLVFSLFFITISLFSCNKKTKNNLSGIAEIELNNRQVYEKCKQSVVRVFTYDDKNRPVSNGSGIVISQNNILTCHHVIRDATEFYILDSMNELYNADLLIVDEFEDLAILKTKKNKALKEIKFAQNPAKLGDRCISLSFPVDGMFLASGYVGAIQRPIRQPNGLLIGGMIASDTKTLAGSSGGALLNKDGELIAMNYSIHTDKYDVNLSYGYDAIQLSRVVKKMLLEASKNNKSKAVRRAWLDLYYASYDANIRKFYNSSSAPNNGILVCGVVKNGNCHDILKSGNREEKINGKNITIGGDIITQIAGWDIFDISDIYTSLRDKNPGDEVEVKFKRGQSEGIAKIKLSPAPNNYYEYFLY